MPPEPRDAAHLWDMLEAARAVRGFVGGRTVSDYVSDLTLRSAVERQIEIIGEAANRVSESFRSESREIPWRGIIAQRNVLAHEYGEIKHERIWKVAVEHIPDLIDRLEPLVPDPPST